MRKALTALVISVSLMSCNVSENMEDGYQAGDITEGLKENKAWYCGEGMMGIRKVARFVVAFTTGTSVPDLCRAIDAITAEPDASSTQ